MLEASGNPSVHSGLRGPKLLLFGMHGNDLSAVVLQDPYMEETTSVYTHAPQAACTSMLPSLPAPVRLSLQASVYQGIYAITVWDIGRSSHKCLKYMYTCMFSYPRSSLLELNLLHSSSTTT